MMGLSLSLTTLLAVTASTNTDATLVWLSSYMLSCDCVALNFALLQRLN